MSDTLIDINASSFVARLISGDEMAFDELYDQMYPKLYTYIRIVFKLDPRYAEEIAQDTMVKVWEKAGDFKPDRTKFTTWIIKIGINKARDFLRLRERKIKGDALDDPEFIYSAEDSAGQEALNRKAFRIFSQILESDDTDAPEKKLIRDVYNSLNKEEQDILFLRVIAEMSYKEISELTGIDENTLKMRYSRAKGKFKRIAKDKLRERQSDS